MNNKSSIIKSLTLFIFIIFISSCTIQKRHYRNGYHVSFDKNSHANIASSNSNKVQVDLNNINESTELSKDIARFLLAPVIKNSYYQTIDSCGDVIVFLDSNQVLSKIIEISDDKLRYIPCNNLNGPVYVISKKKVAYVVYYNSLKEIFNSPIPVNSVPTGTCGDEIIFVNGNKMKVKILEATNTIVRYKSCNNLNGIASEVTMDNISILTYSDGKVINANPVVESPIKKETKFSKSIRIVLGAILGLIGITIVATLLSLGAGSTILVFLYLLFLIFGLGFGYSMGWYQSFPSWGPFGFF